MVIMSLYWLTECIPIGITSLLPMLLFPTFGILSSKETSRIYFQVNQRISFLNGVERYHKNSILF
jgi:sodium-dependent dicarboxylate transporter 2/3/5